jgi:hypothetical protein
MQNSMVTVNSKLTTSWMVKASSTVTIPRRPVRPQRPDRRLRRPMLRLRHLRFWQRYETPACVGWTFRM